NQKLEVAGKLLSDNSYQVIAIEPDDFHIGQNNYFEAHLIVHIIAELLDGGIEMERIGIIAPFRAQVALLRELLPGVLIDTIDRFQGSESDVIILSTTTSAHVPLLTDERRINVALTRAREKMIVVQTNPSRIRQSSLMRTIYRDGFRRGVLTEIGDKEIREYSNEVSSVLERLGLAGVFSPIPQGEVFFGDILLYYGSIPIVIVTLQEEDRCHICYRFTTTGMQCPGCGYLFHEDHLLNWVEQNASCPTCRHRLEIVRL
ncbi:MAG: AAA domain-containing protein, partial [Candidatus Kariarchaeaceae archaeon]